MSDQAPVGTRKLTAILSADVYGYSRLMGANEDETFTRLTECREIIFRTVRTQRGRVANTAGDAVLADFATAREAVTAAVDIQDALLKLNESVPEDRRMFFRIGINLGEVIERGGDLFGDGVNIAARIQSLAEPGGVCVSSVVYEQVRRNPGFEFEYLGEQALKNIAEPIKVYKVVSGPKRELNGAREGTAAVTVRPAEVNRGAEKPSYVVAVLPFDNLSEDPSQSYFSDGLVEDLITGVATIRNIKVPARNTMFTYKGKAVDVQQLAADLGATHVVEGSVRKSGNTIRINVQLIDAKSGNHIWAKRFDSELTNVFQVQDEIVQGIVTELDVRLVYGEEARLWRRGTKNGDAYDLFRQAQYLVQHAGTKTNLQRAHAMLQKAITLDLKFTAAYVWDAHAHLQEAFYGHAADPKAALGLALSRVERALSVDENSAEALSAKGQILWFMRSDEEAEKALMRALDLEPNLPDTYQYLGQLRMRQARYEEALANFRRQVEAYGEDNYNLWGIQGVVHSLMALGRFEETAAYIDANVGRGPDLSFLWSFKARAEAALGHMGEARIAREKLLSLIPDYKNATFISMARRTGYPEELIELFENLGSTAGLP